MYMPGRLRTGSSPSRTWISSPVYLVCAMSIHSLSALGVGERLDRDRPGYDDERRALDDLVALAAAALDLLRIGGDLELLAGLLGREHELVALEPGDEADHHVVVLGLDHRHAAARPLELGDLVGLAQQHVAVARRGDHDVDVAARH